MAMEVVNAAMVVRAAASSSSSSQLKGVAPFQHRRVAREDGIKLRVGLPSCFGALSCALAHAVGGAARALTYEEALGQTVGADTAADIAQSLDSFLNFASENPLVIGASVSVIAVPLIVSRILGGSRAYGVVSAKSGYEKLAQEPDAQLLDIREGKELRAIGRPDVRAAGKKAVAVAYQKDDKPGFLKKIALRFKDPGNTTLLVLDKFDGNSELVAELLTANGFKAAFAIKDGAEGPRGWMNSGLPWMKPANGLSVDFGTLQDALSGAFGDGFEGLPLALGLTAATGLGIFAYTEMETLLQLLGSAAIIQLVAKKFLFAEDRKVTTKQLEEFLNTKVAPKELVDEITTIGKALLPGSSAVQSLPASTVQSSAVTTPTPVETNTEAKADPPVQIGSAAAVEVKDESLPGRPRPLSPYPNYPDFKPPSSPSPSTP